MHFAVGLPNVGAYGDPSLLVELAVEAEAAGWDGVFVWDHVAYREPLWPVADPYVVIAAAAALTTRVRLGVLVSAVPRRRPWKLARELASLDVLSGGRMVLGAGIGSQAQEEFIAFGEAGGNRVRAEKLDEALEIITGLWSGERFQFDGRHYTVTENVFLPRPVQCPRVPIWVAGRWPNHRPFRRAARWDGVFPTHAQTGHADTMTASQLGEIVGYTLAHRAPGSSPLDVIVEGHTDGTGRRQDVELVRSLAEAGLTWWIEKLGWFHGPISIARDRIRAGPCRADE